MMDLLRVANDLPSVNSCHSQRSNNDVRKERLGRRWAISTTQDFNQNCTTSSDWLLQDEAARNDRKRPTTASGRNFINFVTAKQRAVSTRAASKAKQRGTQLLQVSTHSVLMQYSLTHTVLLTWVSVHPARRGIVPRGSGWGTSCAVLVQLSHNRQRPRRGQDKIPCVYGLTSYQSTETFTAVVILCRNEMSSFATSSVCFSTPQIIDLDRAAFDLFDMPPVNEYEMYMRSFGSTNTKQVLTVYSSSTNSRLAQYYVSAQAVLIVNPVTGLFSHRAHVPSFYSCVCTGVRADER